MRRLMLLRHAKSDRPAGVEDQDRPLAERGRRDSVAVGQYLAMAGLLPELALVSTARRTRETFDLLCTGLGRSIPGEEDRHLYAAAPPTMLEVIRQIPGGIGTALVIGHNPGLHQLALALAGEGDPTARRRLGEGLPTAALVVIDFPADDWRSVADGLGTVERFERPGAT